MQPQLGYADQPRAAERTFVAPEKPPALPFIVEIKARCTQQPKIRSLLQERSARFVGEDHQVDTYFRVPQGRLKLREGTIEQTLIYYERADQPRRESVPGSVV